MTHNPHHIPGGARIARAAKQLATQAPKAYVTPKSSASTTVSGHSSAASQELGAAVAQALFGQAAKPRLRMLDLPSSPKIVSQDEGSDMEPIIGSIIQFTPCAPGWTAILLDEDGTPSYEPIVGWGCVVIWAAYDEHNEEEKAKGTKQFQTEIQPVTLSADGEVDPPIFREGVEKVTIAMPGMLPL